MIHQVIQFCWRSTVGCCDRPQKPAEGVRTSLPCTGCCSCKSPSLHADRGKGQDPSLFMEEEGQGLVVGLDGEVLSI